MTLEIETRDVGATIELVVQDNGIGMDAETAARAFEPLFADEPIATSPVTGSVSRSWSARRERSAVRVR